LAVSEGLQVLSSVEVQDQGKTQACPSKEVTRSSIYTRVLLKFGALHQFGVLHQVGDLHLLSLCTYVPPVTLVPSVTTIPLPKVARPRVTKLAVLIKTQWEKV
jgi:hypothetical protein